MRRFLIAIVAIIIVISQVSCVQQEKKDIKVVINDYYEKNDELNKGKIKILVVKPYKENTLVLAQKYSGDGEPHTDLFIINKIMKITKKAVGEEPISMCFTVNIINFDETTIAFGNFKDSKWLVETDAKKAVKIENIYVKFKNGEIFKENVDMDKGYILFTKSNTEIETMNLYNKNNELQSSLEDLERYGKVFDEAEFVDITE